MPVAVDLHGESVALEVAAHDVAHLRVVLDDQHLVASFGHGHHLVISRVWAEDGDHDLREQQRSSPAIGEEGGQR